DTLPAPASAAPTAARPRSAVASRPARAPLRLRPGLVDDEVAVPEQMTVQHLDRLGRLLLRGHLHEAEPARPPCALVRDDPHRFHGAGLLKQFPEILLRGLKRKVADEKLGGHHTTSCPTRAAEKGTVSKVETQR